MLYGLLTLATLSKNHTRERLITICSIYIPPDYRLSSCDVETDQLPDPYLMVGDAMLTVRSGALLAWMPKVATLKKYLQLL